MDAFDQSQNAKLLIHLRQEHRDLDAAIDHMLAVPSPDELAVKRLKKRKLSLKDTIAQLESSLIPDEPA